jgi:hypothetical protein
MSGIIRRVVSVLLAGVGLTYVAVPVLLAQGPFTCPTLKASL